jgi:hypothetical protein
MTTISWQYKDIPIEVTVSNIEWDNDSVGVTDFGGAIRDDIQADYISAFDVDDVILLEHPDSDQDNITILHYKFDEDADFIAKLEEVEKDGW